MTRSAQFPPPIDRRLASWCDAFNLPSPVKVHIKRSLLAHVLNLAKIREPCALSNVLDAAV
jgi:hypothetical protein